MNKAPQAGHSAKQVLLETGAYRVDDARRRHVITFHGRKRAEEVVPSSPQPSKPKRDPLALAHFYRSLLDSGVVENKAALARYLRVSRARVTQVLARLRIMPSTPPDESADGGAGSSSAAPGTAPVAGQHT